MDKSPDAFRTISEVADWLDTPAHVLRFWESRFTQVKPVKRAGGRRYYRPADMALLGGIKKLLHDDGMTIRGVQKLLREHGVKYVASLSPVIDGVDPVTAQVPEHTPIPPVPFAPMAEMVPQDVFDAPEPEERVIPFARPEPSAPVTAPDIAPMAEETDTETDTDSGIAANVFGLQTAEPSTSSPVEPPATPKPAAPQSGQASFDFDLGPMADLFEEPEVIEDEPRDEPPFDLSAPLPEAVDAGPDGAEDDDAEDNADSELTAQDEVGEAPAEIAAFSAEFSADVIPESAADAPDEIGEAFETAASHPALGTDLDLPDDPSDQAELAIFTGILGKLNHRHLRHVSQAEMASLLGRAETLRARMAG